MILSERRETDYLVVGAGLTGTGFTDALVAACDAEVLLVDRRHAPGGHWLDAYPFVRLHVPSAYYGVDSTPLGRDARDAAGPNAGLYELASAAEICAYFSRVLDEVLLPTGQVAFLARTEHEEVDGRHVLRNLVTGRVTEVVVRRAVVDATYLEGTVPARSAPAFDVHPDVRLVTPTGLVDVADAPSRFVVLGSGKTAVDVVLWLLGQGVDAERLTWVRPREAWMLDRAGYQPLDLVAEALDGVAREFEALAEARSVADLMVRLEERGRMLRVDPTVEPAMFRCATVSRGELALLRTVTDVVRLGRVRAVTPDRVVLDGGSLPLPVGAVLVDATAAGIRRTAPRPVFAPGRIVLQPVRACLPAFNPAYLGRVEASGRDVDAKNALSRPCPYPARPEDWLSGFAASAVLLQQLKAEPDLAAWLATTRLNPSRGLRERRDDPDVARAAARFGAAVGPGSAGLRQLLGSSPAPA